MSRPALQTNASQRSQVTFGKRFTKTREREDLAALLEVLQTPAGRLVLWRWLSETGLYESTFSMDPLVMANRAGRQDYGHERLAEILTANGDLYELMEHEARMRLRRQDREIEAVHTPTAADDEEERDG